MRTTMPPAYASANQFMMPERSLHDLSDFPLTIDSEPWVRLLTVQATGSVLSVVTRDGTFTAMGRLQCLLTGGATVSSSLSGGSAIVSIQSLGTIN